MTGTRPAADPSHGEHEKMSAMPDIDVPMAQLLDAAARTFYGMPADGDIPQLPGLRALLKDTFGELNGEGRLAAILRQAYLAGRADEAATWGPGEQLWSVRFDDGTVASPGAFSGEKGARCFAGHAPGRTAVTQRRWVRESGWEPA